VHAGWEVMEEYQAAALGKEERLCREIEENKRNKKQGRS